MRRREFIALLGSGVAGWPLAARAQQPAMPVIGFLHPTSPEEYARPLAAFRQGLNETGYVEGHNVAVEYRWAHGRYDRLPMLAAELVHRGVTVIAATSDTSARAAKEATATIPIVFSSAMDPVERGLVPRLSRPGGNLTGVSRMSTELEAKRLALLHEAVPGAAVFGLLINPTSSVADTITEDVRAAARSAGLQIELVKASTDREIEGAIASLVERRAGALQIGGNSFFNSRSEQLGALSIRNGLPAIYQGREFTMAGGLISYGTSITDAFRLIGVYTGRILKGEKPADLPVQQPTNYELIVNLRTAKTIGIEVPTSLLLRADEVIE
jgi:putative tryptophan/tyrosine transport system substrate-binding protein